MILMGEECSKGLVCGGIKNGISCCGYGDLESPPYKYKYTG